MRRLPILFQLKKERHFRIILKFLILDRWPYLEKILLLLLLLLLLLYKRVGYEASVINVLLQSNIPGCSPPDGSHLIFTKRNRSAVNNTDMIFVFDWDGVIYRKCNKKVDICPDGKNLFLNVYHTHHIKLQRSFISSHL